MSSIVRKPKNQLAASLYSLVTLHATHAKTAGKTLSFYRRTRSNSDLKTVFLLSNDTDLIAEENNGVF